MKKQWHKYRRAETVLATEYRMGDDISDVFVNPDHFPLVNGDMLLKMGEIVVGLPKELFDKRWTRLNGEVILIKAGGEVA